MLGLIDRPKFAEALSAKSEVDRRLRGYLVWRTASQAIALTIARSRGGKGASPAARLITKEKLPHAQRWRQRWTELECNSIRAPAATFDRFDDSWSKRTNRALWRLIVRAFACERAPTFIK